jgi:hypothetical protein
MPSSVCLRNGFGADDDGRGAVEGRGGEEGLAAAGTEARASGTGVALAAGTEARGGGTGVALAALEPAEAGPAAGDLTEAELAGAGFAMRGTGGAAGMSSAPHSESMSSVGGAIDGIGGRPLTRSLGLSVIALKHGAFHGLAHKSSAVTTNAGKDRLMAAGRTDLSGHGRRALSSRRGWRRTGVA